jgi:hypothetical protein
MVPFIIFSVCNNSILRSIKYIFKTCVVQFWWFFLIIFISNQNLQAQPISKFNRAVIRPSLIKLAPGDRQQFKIIMIATRLNQAYLAKEVKWFVNNIPGGNKELGTIDANGLYRAPQKSPTPPEINICAEVNEAVNRKLWATILMDNPTYKLVQSWGESIENLKYFKNPHGMCIDIDGNLLIADQGAHRVLRFTPDGKYLGDVGSGIGGKPGYFLEPRVVEIDSIGNIFVGDEKDDKPRIQVFSPQGKFLRIFGDKGTGIGQILRTHGLGFDTQQRLYVTDVDNMHVNVYTHSGEFLYSWGKDGMNPGEFNAPHGIALDANNDVFVPGFYGPVQKFGPEGNFIFAFGHANPPNGPVTFHALNSDRWGNIYLIGGSGGDYTGPEAKKVSITKYNNNGDLITTWSLSQPDYYASWGAVDDNGKVSVLFKGKDRYGVEAYIEQ